MVCKNCGTALIRGHAFCMNCGTPVPAGASENDDEPVTDLFAGANGGDNSAEGGSDAEEGTLVFCPACGMHMQKDPNRCEKCGMILRENIHSDNPQNVPAFNPDVGVGELSGGALGEFGFGGMGSIGGDVSSVGGGMASIGGSMASIGGGMASIGGNMESVGAASAGGMASIGGGMESIGRAAPPENNTPNMFNTSNDDELGALASFSFNPTNMSSIDAPDRSNVVRQKEPEKGQERKMEDFSMSDGGDDSDTMSDNAVRVIEGGSMDEDASKDIELDPYKFIHNSMGDMLDEEPEKPAESTSAPASEAVPEPIAPIIVPFEAIAPEPVAPIEEPVAETVPEPVVPIIAPVEEAAPEPAAPAVEPVAETVPEPVVPIIAPVEEAALEPAAPAAEPVAETVPEPVVPIIAPVAETVPEPVVPIIAPVEEAALEPAAPAAEPVAETAPEPVVPIIAPVEEAAPEPVVPIIAPVEEAAPEPVVPIIAPVEEAVPEPAAPAVEPVAETVPEPAPKPQEMSAASAVASTAAATAVLPEPLTANMPVKENTPNNNIPLNRPDPSKADNAPDASKGKLVYCRNCGQDMYETEAVCKNCGAPYKGAYVPPRNAPSRTGGGSGSSGEPKKIFGIFAPSTFAGIIGVAVVVIALGIFIGVRSNSVKTPDIGGNTANVSSGSTSSDTVNSASGDTSSSVPPVQSSTDVSSASSEDPTSSSETPSSSNDTQSSSSIKSTPGSTAQSSSQKPQSSSTKPQSSSTTQSSTATTPANQMSAKVKSLEADRVKIMNAVEALAGEVGKIEALVRNANYALDHSTSAPITTLNAFFADPIGKNFLDSIKNNRISVALLVDNAKPANSELNSLYESLKTLRARYNDCYNFITDFGSSSMFKTNAASCISKFNSQLSSMDFNKFVTSAYTTANKDQAYASMLRSAQTHINGSASAFATLQGEIVKLGATRYSYRVKETIENNMIGYINGAAAAGKLNAYRLILLGASSSYSSNYSAVSSSYNSISTIIDRHVNATDITLNDYTADTNTAISNARSNATKIGNAIARAF